MICLCTRILVFCQHHIARLGFWWPRKKKSSHPIWWCVPKLLTMCGWNFKWSHPSLRTLTRNNRDKGVMNTRLSFLQTSHKVHFELKLSFTWRTEIIAKIALQKKPQRYRAWYHSEKIGQFKGTIFGQKMRYQLSIQIYRNT